MCFIIYGFGKIPPVKIFFFLIFFFFSKKEKLFLAEYVYKKSPAAGTAGEEKGG